MTEARTIRAGDRVWPIGVASFLALFAAGVVGVVIWSCFHREDLVSPDYYNRELRYGEQMDRVARGAARAGDVALVVEPDRLTLRFHRAAAVEGRVSFYRPSDAALDFERPLALDGEGRQVIDTHGLRAGFWRVRLSWREAGVDYYREEAVTVGAPEGAS